MMHRLLLTGSSGLIGTALHAALVGRGVEVECLDLHADGRAFGDVRDLDRVRRAMRACDGVVHLAAVSRVILGERDPGLCWATNVGGLDNVLRAAAEAPLRPWVVFASSREVYGQPPKLPVTEDAPLRPVNVYGRSKVEGERLVTTAARAGVRASVVRLSNVFGSTRDHVDRVVPAFARAAVLGHPLRVEGAESTFDFTHVADVTRGLVELVRLMADGGLPPPPIQLVSGVPTTLGDLARLIVDVAGSRSRFEVGAPRAFDVARFHGSPARALALLGWSATTPLDEGVWKLVGAFRAELGVRHVAEAVP